MADGTITGSFSGGDGSSAHDIYIEWEQEEGDGGSTVYATLYAGQNKTWGTYKASAPYTLKINGTTVASGNYNYDERSYTGKKIFEIASGSTWVSHSGSKSITISGTLNLSGTSAGTGSASGTAKLDPVVSYVTVYVSDWDNTASEAIRKKWASAQFIAGESVDAGDYWGTEPPSDIYEYVDSDDCTAYEGAIAWRNFRQKRLQFMLMTIVGKLVILVKNGALLNSHREKRFLVITGAQHHQETSMYTIRQIQLPQKKELLLTVTSI